MKMGEKVYGQERESKKHKRRVQKINCSKCKAKIIVEEEIENGNFSEIAGVKFLECPQCGQEIIIK
jgi:DNA-directed RNA polymerase subunit RPC12/RpoP